MAGDKTLFFWFYLNQEWRQLGFHGHDVTRRPKSVSLLWYSSENCTMSELTRKSSRKSTRSCFTFEVVTCITLKRIGRNGGLGLSVISGSVRIFCQGTAATRTVCPGTGDRDFFCLPKTYREKAAEQDHSRKSRPCHNFWRCLKLTPAFAVPPNAKISGWNQGIEHRTILADFTST